MEKNKGDIRKLLLYEFQLGHNATEAARNINNAKGDGTVPIRTAQNWFLNFRSGNLSTDDQARSGRPREVDRDAVIEAITDHPSKTTRMLADDFDCSQSQIDRILKDAGIF